LFFRTDKRNPREGGREKERLLAARAGLKGERSVLFSYRRGRVTPSARRKKGGKKELPAPLNHEHRKSACGCDLMEKKNLLSASKEGHIFLSLRENGQRSHKKRKKERWFILLSLLKRPEEKDAASSVISLRGRHYTRAKRVKGKAFVERCD